MKKGVYVFIISLFFISFVSANLDLRIYSIEPSFIENGEDFTVGIQIENTGTLDVSTNLEFKYLGKDLQLKENKTTYFENIRKNGGIEGKVYHFHVDSNAVNGQRLIELVLKWSPINSNLVFEQTKTFYVDIKSDSPELFLAGMKTSPEKIFSKEIFDLTIKIENSGEGIAKNVRVKLEGLEAQGTKYAYLGKIEPNENLPAKFILKASETGEQKHTIKIEYEHGKENYEKTFEGQIFVFKKDWGIYLTIFSITLSIFLIYFLTKKLVLHKNANKKLN